MAFQHINLDYLDLMSDGDDDMKKTMIEMLLEEVPAEVTKMNQAQQNEDWNELKELSHKLKSTLAFIGNPTLTTSNERVETIAKTESDLGELPDLLEALNSTYPMVLDELKLVFATMEA